MSDKQLTFRVDEKTQTKAEKIVSEMGLTLPTVMRMLLTQIVNYECIPFTIKGRTYNLNTLKAINEDTKNYTRYDKNEVKQALMDMSK